MDRSGRTDGRGTSVSWPAGDDGAHSPPGPAAFDPPPMAVRGLHSRSVTCLPPLTVTRRGSAAQLPSRARLPHAPKWRNGRRGRLKLGWGRPRASSKSCLRHHQRQHSGGIGFSNLGLAARRPTCEHPCYQSAAGASKDGQEGEDPQETQAAEAEGREHREGTVASARRPTRRRPQLTRGTPGPPLGVPG